jgi:5-methylcytosine-specific restriction endonuclease McrA
MARPISVQTGQPKGTYKLGDKHPSLPDRFFKVYRKHVKDGYRESWVSAKSLDTLRERSKDYYICNKEDRLLYRAKYTQLNPEKVKKAQHNYYLNNKAQRRAYTKAREAGLAKAYSTLPDTHKGIVKGIYEASQRISKCLGVTFHVDHIVPISKGGQHTPDNLQIVPAKWNLQKSNKNNARWD